MHNNPVGVGAIIGAAVFLVAGDPPELPPEPTVPSDPVVTQDTSESPVDAAEAPAEVPIQRPRARREDPPTTVATPEPPAEPIATVEAAEGTINPFASPAPSGDDDYAEEAWGPRPPPPPPPVSTIKAEPESYDDPPPPPNSNLAWGLHDPVARWKRVGLIASASTVGLAAVAGGISWGIYRAQSNQWAERLREVEWNGVANCERNGNVSGNMDPVDATLANTCRRGQAANRVVLGSMVVGTLGLASTVTFGILHLVRRTDVPMTQARIRPTRNGVALRF